MDLAQIKFPFVSNLVAKPLKLPVGVDSVVVPVPGSKSMLLVKMPTVYTFPALSSAISFVYSEYDPPILFAQMYVPALVYLAITISCEPLDVKLTVAAEGSILQVSVPVEVPSAPVMYTLPDKSTAIPLICTKPPARCFAHT